MCLSVAILRLFLISSYITCIVLGIATLFVSIFFALTNDDFGLDYSTSNIVSVLSIVIGILGIIGILRTRRILLMIATSLLAVAIVLLVLSVVLEIMTINKPPVSKAHMNYMKEKIIKQYGDNQNEKYKEFTAFIDKTQKEKECCGWTDDETENLFIKTPWYKAVNSNVPSGKKITLPDSCCLDVIPSCREAVDLKEARKNEFVYKWHNCLSTKKSGGMSLSSWMSLSAKMLASVCQAVCIAATVKWLITPVE